MSEPTSRFYLVTPPIDDAESFAPALDAALGAGDVACVWLRAGSGDSGAVARALRSLIADIQIHGVAALVDDHIRVAADVDADGVHVPAVGAGLTRALSDLRPSRIVGAGGLALRDDAMTAGESDVDYVMFGEAFGDVEPLPFDERREVVAWWAEIFQVPCVAFAHDMREIEVFAAHGAEFIALGDVLWSDPRGPVAAMQDAQAALHRGVATFAAGQAAGAR